MLARYLRILRELSETPLREYQADPRNFGSAERFLQLAIETTLSIGHHLIAEAGWDQPTSCADIFRVLGRKRVLSPEFADEPESMARMRNRLVHVYEDVDPAVVHELLRTRLDDFDHFAQAVTHYVDDIDAAES